MCYDLDCYDAVDVIAFFDLNAQLVWNEYVISNTYSINGSLQFLELENKNIKLKFNGSIINIKTNGTKPDNHIIDKEIYTRMKPPTIPIERDFQEIGGRVGFPLTVLTPHQNFDGVKPFDKYHFGYKGELHFISKPATPNTKLKFSTGFFIYGDAVSNLIALTGQVAPFENSRSAVGIANGLALVYKNTWEFGVEHSLGFYSRN